MDYFLGRRPTGATTDSKVDMGMIVRDIDELMILNEEAVHIHDNRLAWFRKSDFQVILSSFPVNLQFAELSSQDFQESVPKSVGFL